MFRSVRGFTYTGTRFCCLFSTILAQSKPHGHHVKLHDQEEDGMY